MSMHVRMQYFCRVCVMGTVLDKHKVTTEELIKHCSDLQLALTLG